VVTPLARYVDYSVIIDQVRKCARDLQVSPWDHLDMRFSVSSSNLDDRTHEPC
jgi:hypothetical protein